MSSACAKFILGGEHSVLSRGWAIAFPYKDFCIQIDDENFESAEESFLYNNEKIEPSSQSKIIELYSFLKLPKVKSLKLTGNIPIAKGLGSSAALCVALIKRHFADKNPTEVALLATKAEEIFHGQSSGIDPHTISLEKAIAMNPSQNNFIELDLSLFQEQGLTFKLIDSGIEHDTKDVISKISQIKKLDPRFWNYKMDQLAFNAEAMIEALKLNPKKLLPPLMTQSQNVFRHLQLSNQACEKAVNTHKKNGALAAKITGAGCGGYVIGLYKKEI